MASFSLISYSTSARTLTNGETGYIGLGGQLVTTNEDAVLHNDGTATVVVLGSITAIGSNNQAQAISTNATAFRLTIGTNGSLTSSAGAAVFTTSSIATDIQNFGTINGFTDGIIADSFSNSADFELINHGSVVGSINGVRGSFGIDTFVLANTGTISGASAGITLTNMNGVNDVIDVQNAGTITGNQNSYIGGLARDKLVNTGTMIGDISLGEGNDHFDGRGGSVAGTVHGGLGDDTFIVDDPTLALVENAAEGTDLVRAAVSWSLGANVENLDLLGAEALNGTGNTAANTITGNAGANRISGLGGNDSLLGGDGEDVIFGGAGNDSLRGGDGDDDLRGQSGNDNIRGQNGDDRVVGNGGNDRLFGDAGRDTIIGGAGEDTLYGGTEADLFVYRTVSDSPTGTGRDKIQGFELGLDQIDLRQIAPGTLGFVGTGALSGSGPEVQLVTFGGTNTRIRIDADGNGSIDMLIDVIGATGMSEADFLL